MSSSQWFIGLNGRQLGPYQFETIQLLAARGKLNRDDLVWTEGMRDWARADSVPLLWPSIAAAQGKTAPATQPAATTVRPSEAVDAAQHSAGSRNYLARHWRGEFTLPVAYWINGTGIQLLFLGLITAVRAAGLTEHLGATGTGLWLLSLLMTTVAIGVWTGVGIWRSAGHHMEHGGRTLWANLAKCAVVLGMLRLAAFGAQEAPMLQQSVGLLMRGDTMPAARLHVVNHGTEVELAGGMSFGAADSLRTILDATPTIRTVQLNNVGGWVTEGYRIGQLIRQRGLATYTARQCNSACLLAFMGGTERYLNSKGRLGFHEASVAGVGGEVAKGGTNRFREVFKENGVPDSFVERALATPPSTVWYPTARELLDAHVITAVVDGRDFAATDEKGWRDRSRLEAQFAAVPVFAALLQAEPTAYENLKETYVTGIQQGTPATEMSAKMRSVIVQKLLPKYLRLGPDEPLIEYWRTQSAELHELRAIDPQDCVDYLFPSARTDVLGLTDKLSKSVKNDDLASLTRLLEASGRSTAQPPSQAAIQGPLRQVALRIERQLPGALKAVTNPEAAKAQPGVLCNAEIEFFDQILALPAEEAAPLLRFVAASADTTKS
jgi:hypothetical protein